MDASSFVLCRSQSNNDSLTNPAGTRGRIQGSTCGCTAAEVLVTVQGDGVVAYNSAKQQRTRSWPLGARGSTFVAPAIWDSHTARYYAVLESPSEGQKLVAWEKPADVGSPTASLAEAPARTALTGGVHSLWAVSQPRRKLEHASGAVVVFHDGSVAVFDGELTQTCRLEGLERGVVEAAAASRGNGGLFLAVSVYDRGAGKRTVRVLELVSNAAEGSEGIRDALELRQQVDLLQSGEAAVASVSLGESLDLSILWSDGRWESMSADSKSAGEGLSYKPGHERKLALFGVSEATRVKNKKTPKKRANLEEGRSSSGAKSSGRLLALPGSSYVAAVGPEVKADGGSGGLVVVILDTVYGCLHKRFPLAAGTEEKSDSLSTLLDTRSSVSTTVVELQTGGEPGQLLVSTSEEVIVCSASLPPLSLAGMLGALARTPRVSAPAGAEADGRVGWGATAREAAATALEVYGESGMESLGAPASTAVLTPSISQRGSTTPEMSLVEREEGIWEVESGASTKEEEVLRRIREAKSEAELASVLVEHFGGVQKGGDAEPPGVNGGPNGVHENGRNGSDDSEMEDARPNGSVHENGFAEEKTGKKHGQGSKGTSNHLSRVLRRSSAQLVTAVVERSLQSEFWSVIESVLWSGSLLTASVGPFLIRAFAGAQQLRLLEMAVAHSRDAAPTDLAFLLRFLISDADQEQLRQLAGERKQSAAAKLTKLAGAVKEGQVSKARQREVTAVRLVADAVDLFTPREAALHALVAVLRDETVLAAALRELNAAEVTLLVGYFAKWMDVYFDRSEVSAPKWGRVVLPSLGQVLLWLSLLLDVHLTRLVLLPDCHQVVGRLHRVVAAQVALTRKLVPLGGVTTHIRSKAPLPSKRAPSGKPAGGYSVEVLSLD